jgi:hypothetical protein
MPRLPLGLVVALGALLAVGWLSVPEGGAAPATGASAADLSPRAVLTRIDGGVTATATARRASAQPGNPGGVPLPAEAAPVDTSHPDVVVGHAGGPPLAHADARVG